MKRLDVSLVEKGVFPSREQAKRAIEDGLVRVNGKVVFKPSFSVSEEDELEGKAFEFVSRGALKLKHALEVFQISLENKVVLDIGASTGGFTDVALTFGAKKVYAVDTGHDQLDKKIRDNKKVLSFEKTNYLSFDKSNFPDVNFVCIDVSFVSLTKLIDKLWEDFALKDVDIVALIKPQFECGAKYAKAHKGVVKDEKVRQKAVKAVTEAFEEKGFVVKKVTKSPILGGDGNEEFLMWAKTKVENF